MTTRIEASAPPLALGGARTAGPVSNDLDWGRLLAILSRRRRVVAGVAATTFALILAATLLAPRSYTTHVTLIAGKAQAGPSDDAMHAGGMPLPLLDALLAAGGVRTTETYATLLHDTPVADEVVRTLKLPASSATLLKHVNVKPVVNTNLLDLSVSWPDRNASAQIANAFAGAFVDRERDLVTQQAEGAITTISRQLPSAQRHASDAARALALFETRHQLADIQVQTQNTIAAAAAIDAKIKQTRLESRDVAATLGSIDRQLAGMNKTVGAQTTVAPNPTMAQLQSQLAQIEVQLNVARQQYTDQHPTVVGLTHQVAELNSEIAHTPATVVAQANTTVNPVYQQLLQQAATLRAQRAADDAQLDELQRQRLSMKPQIDALPLEATQLLELQREAKLRGDILSALQQKLSEAGIAKATALSDLTVTSPADPRNATVRPDVLLNTLVGFFVSLALGMLAAIVVHQFDRRIRDVHQLESELDLPILARVPALGLAADAPAKAGALAIRLRARTVESFLELVTALRYSTTDRQIGTIAVTSASQGDGKSSIALRTAITLAHLEPRVLLIDADLRRPSLHTKLDRERGRGLSDLLVGTAAIDAVISATEYDGLDVLTSGTPTPNPVKLLQSKRFDDVIEALRARYHTIVIDAPALNPVVDAAILAAKADATVMVIAMNATDNDAVRRALAKIESVGTANVVGIVANQVPADRRSLDDDYFFIEPTAAVALP